MPSFDGGDDLARVFCPDKWLWVGIGIGDEAVDCVREFLERTKHAALEAPLGQEREQTFDSIEPGCRGRSEVEDKARVASEPFQDFGMLVRGVVVDDDVDGQLRRHSGVDEVQEADELLMAMTLHALADDFAFEHVEGSEQGRGAMTFVVMSHGDGPPLLHRQARLGAVARLNLALLIYRQNDGMVRRIDIEADDVAQLGDELRIIGQLELTHPVGLQAMGAPDALDRTDADPDRFGHGRARPMGRVRGRASQGQGHHAFGNIWAQWRDARRSRLVAPQPGSTVRAKPLLPTPDDGLSLSSPPHDLKAHEVWLAPLQKYSMTGSGDIQIFNKPVYGTSYLAGGNIVEYHATVLSANAGAIDALSTDSAATPARNNLFIGNLRCAAQNDVLVRNHHPFPQY